MQKYLSLLRCGFLNAFMYKKNFIVSMLANFFQVIILYYVWKSVFMYQEVVNDYTWENMKQYVFISFLCNSTFSFGFEMQMAERIIKGDIILDLLKPISYRTMIFYRMLGMAGMEFLITFFFTSIAYICINGVAALSLFHIFIAIISLFIGQGIKFQIQYLFAMLCFYTDNAYGVVMAREVITNFLSGAILPLVIFPKQIKIFIGLLPFSGIVFIPCSIFMGTYTKVEIIYYITFQLLWNLILFIIGSIFWNKASSKVVIYGG